MKHRDGRDLYHSFGSRIYTTALLNDGSGLVSRSFLLYRSFLALIQCRS